MAKGEIILLCVVWFYVLGSVTSFALGEEYLSSSLNNPTHKLDATVEYLGLERTPTLWQIPLGTVKKVLFLAICSGCLPWEYWDRTPGCPLCTGLPEPRKIVLDALAQSYAVVLVSPLDGQSWEAWPEDSADLRNVVSILSFWKKSHGFDDIPMVALGISSGGHALSTLGLRGSRFFESMVIMVSKGVRQAWGLVQDDFPPTLFVHCPREWGTAKDILSIVGNLRSKGIEANEIGWFAHPITPTWFSQLIPGLDPPTSRAIYDTFKSEGWVLDEDDYLLQDVFDWRSVVRARGILPTDHDNAPHVLYESAINQEIKVAYAMHTTVSRKDDVIFKWFEGDYDVRKAQNSTVNKNDSL